MATLHSALSVTSQIWDVRIQRRGFLWNCSRLGMNLASGTLSLAKISAPRKVKAVVTHLTHLESIEKPTDIGHGQQLCPVQGSITQRLGEELCWLLESC